MVNSPTVNSFEIRLNKHWYGHPNKFEARCYQAGPNTRMGKYGSPRLTVVSTAGKIQKAVLSVVFGLTIPEACSETIQTRAF